MQDREEVEDPLAGRVRGRAVTLRHGAEPQVVGDGQLREDAAPLGSQGQAAAHDLLRRESLELVAAEDDPSAGYRDEAADGVQKARLPRAVRAEQGDDLALLDADRRPPVRPTIGP